MRSSPLFLAAMLASCGVQSPDPDPGQPGDHPPIESRELALTSFQGPTACADLERYIEDRAVLDMRARVDQARTWALQSFDWQHSGGPQGTIDAGTSAAGGGSGAGGSSGAGPLDFTTTNTQVTGIDEPDIIKNDGTRLFVVSGRKLFTATTWPATALSTRGSVALEGTPFELLLEGTRVIVFSRALEPSFGQPLYCAQYGCPWFSNATLITHLDVSDLAAPRIVATQRVPGAYESARRVGDVIRLVTSSTMPFLDSLDTWLSWDEQQSAATKAELSKKFTALADANERLIRRQPLSTWLPSAVLDGATAPLSCSDISTTNASARLGLTNIVTLHLNDPQAFERQSLIAAIDELYQGPDALYLSQRHWWWGTSGTDQTYVYQFDLSQPDRVTFRGGARVEGRPLNQFAFDERAGVLRMAVTVRAPTGTVNRVITLANQNGVLEELGRTVDLAPGESITSARFIGDLAYVVTFRQTDPLWVIDLHDPAHPTKRGELHIPGFSTYLHPLDATHLLTIGVDIPEAGPTWERQLQLQIFDVSDPTQPRRTFTQHVGHAYGWSEAQGNHKAFNFFPSKGLLAIPFSDWYQDPVDGAYRYVSDLRVFHVDAASGFVAKGALDMADVLRRDGCEGGGCFGWWWEPQVRRSVMADDFVYAVSSGGVRVAHVDSLGTPIATALFDPAP